MAYEPTVWKSGDVVTSAKLNKLEQGVASCGGVMVVTDTEGTLNKTWQEICDAATVGAVFIKSIYEGSLEKSIDLYLVNLVSFDSGGYYAAIVSGADAQGLQYTYYVTNSADGYPVASSP